MNRLPRRDTIVILIATIVLWLMCAMFREQLIPFHATGDRRSYLLTGDEPEYMLAAWSLAHDGDLNLYNNVREKSWNTFQERDVCAVGHGELAHFQRISPPMARVPPEAWNGRQLLIHRPGTSVLISPAAFSKERFRWWAYLIVSTVACLGFGGMLLMAAREGIPAVPAGLLAGLLVLSPPGVFYVNQAYPEMPVAVLLALSACLLFRASSWAILGSGLCVAIVPWFSDRAILPAACLGLTALWAARKSRALPVLAAIFGVAAVLLVLYYWRRFHVPWPVSHDWRNHPSIRNIPALLPRIVLDRGRGILWLCPALVMLPAAFYFWFRSGTHRTLCAGIAVAMLAGLMGVATFPGWEGGVCPVGRGRYGVLYEWLALPVFLAWYKAGMSTKQKILLLLPLLAGAAVALMVLPHPNWWYRAYHPLFGYPFLGRFYDVLPDLKVMDVPAIAKAAGWLAVFALYNALAVLSAPPVAPRADESGR